MLTIDEVSMAMLSEVAEGSGREGIDRSGYVTYAKKCKVKLHIVHIARPQGRNSMSLNLGGVNKRSAVYWTIRE